MHDAGGYPGASVALTGLDLAADEAAASPRLSVVVLDREETVRALLRGIVASVEAAPDVHEFPEGREALAWCGTHEVDLLLVEYRMPGIDGLEFVRRFRRMPMHGDTPVIFLTDSSDDALRQAALEAGAIDVLSKPVQPRELHARCRSLLDLRLRVARASRHSRVLERRLDDSLKELDARERETLSRLARAIEYRDAGTSAYLERMAHIAGLVAEQLGLPEDEVRLIEMAAPLHDLGKIAIPDAVLLKAGPLDEDERAVMRRHPVIGHELLAGSASRYLRLGALIALRHHERYDGSGYPDGLAGEAIPLAARIVATADVFDALLSPRPYKPAWSFEAALAYMRVQRGRLFDPRCVDALQRGRERLRALCERWSTARPRPG